jgi:hypothetical protein
MMPRTESLDSDTVVPFPTTKSPSLFCSPFDARSASLESDRRRQPLTFEYPHLQSRQFLNGQLFMLLPLVVLILVVGQGLASAPLPAGGDRPLAIL